jgi:hypothetical protein
MKENQSINITKLTINSKEEAIAQEKYNGLTR